MYKPLSDYGLVGNLRTAALVGRDGSIDWCCLPDFDSPSLFAALLDARRGGRFRVGPAGRFDSSQSYAGKTNVLETAFDTGSGRLLLTDFMPAGWPGEVPPERLPTIHRRLVAQAGGAEVEVEFSPRFDYARQAARLEVAPFGVVAASGEGTCTLFAPADFRLEEGGAARGRLRLREGEEAWLTLRYGPPGPVEPLQQAEADLRTTLEFWNSWAEGCERGQCEDFGGFAPMVRRSSLLLKLLTYAPSGAFVAAPTTSLPERIGGPRNWDYRYCWLRDASLTVRALYAVGHLSEMEAFLNWLQGICQHARDLHIVYAVHGGIDLHERELDHLEGWRGSRPVRIGNAAFDQRQLDVYGEVLWAAARLSEYVGAIDAKLWHFLREVCDHVCRSWQLPDRGIWEVRAADHHFVHSKLMCWVALNSGLTMAARYGFDAPEATWARNREMLRAEILERGWSGERRSFVREYGASELDASLLRLPLTGFLPPDDPRVEATVRAIRRGLGEDGFLRRYLAEDGLEGGEGCFVLLNFWLAQVLAAQGKLDEAERLIADSLAAAGPLGLMAEEYDPASAQMLGNYPKVFSHIGFINACASLAAARRASRRPVPPPRRRLPEEALLLNAQEPGPFESVERVAARLRQVANLLRGAFFDPLRGRIDYQRMCDSPLYERYRRAAAALQHCDPRHLGSRQELLAFWIDIYNTLVIHGVIELGVSESVLEAPGFFRLIRYRIGPFELSAEDIHHGVLRGNAGPRPGGPPQFAPTDPRRELVIEPLEPRVHFALGCGADFCPPVAVYEAERLGEQLDLAARTFLRRRGLVLDRQEGVVYLSALFDQYRHDFGPDLPSLLRFLLPYLDEEDRGFVEGRLEELEVRFMPRDWRLNRWEA